MRTMPMKVLAVVLPILLAGCQTTGTGAIDACAHWRSLTWSKADTPETVDEVKGNNARRSAWCR